MSESQPSADQRHRSALGVVGLVLMYLGAAFVFFLMIARSPESTIPLPRFLHLNRELWLVSGGAVVALGMICLRRSGSAAPAARSPFKRLVFYTRKPCPLCDEAWDVLQKYRDRLPGIDVVDIDESEDLVAEFGESVPVVEIDGRARFRGRIDEMLFRRLMDGAAAEPDKTQAADS